MAKNQRAGYDEELSSALAALEKDPEAVLTEAQQRAVVWDRWESETDPS